MNTKKKPHFVLKKILAQNVPKPPPPPAKMYQKNPRNVPENPPRGVFWYILGVVRGVFWYILGASLVFGGGFLVHSGGFIGTFWGVFWYIPGGGVWYISGGGGLWYILGGVYGTIRGGFAVPPGGLLYNSGGFKYTSGIFSTFCRVSFWVLFNTLRV